VGTGGSVIQPTNINISGTTAVFTLPDTYASKSIVVIATVNKSGSTLTEKDKTLSAETVITKTTIADATASEILLGKADCYRLFSVRVEPLLFTVAITTILFDAYVSGKVNTAVVPLILILVG
jgi:hypothetical protein